MRVSRHLPKVTASTEQSRAGDRTRGPAPSPTCSPAKLSAGYSVKSSTQESESYTNIRLGHSVVTEAM